MNLQEIAKKETTTIVDVRESFETFFGKVDGAVHIPLRKIAEKMDDFHQMSQPIIVYCRSGKRSEKAMKLLKILGIQEVYNGGSVADVKALLK